MFAELGSLFLLNGPIPVWPWYWISLPSFSCGLVWSNAIKSVASGLAALMAVALRFLSCYSATVRVT